MLPSDVRYYRMAAIVFITIGSFFVLSNNSTAQIKHTFKKETEKKKDITPNIANDSTAKIQDTTHIKSEAIQNDTLPLYIPLAKHGSLFLTKSNFFKRISKEDLLWEDYFGLFDVLTNNLPSYPLYQGAYYLYNGLSMFGTGQRSCSFRFNNRPINEANFGTFNIDMYPTEFLENAEILIGSDAVIFSNNSTGALINLQEIRYNASTPYTKLWLNQAGTTMITSDGVFSQNIAPNFNATVGFRAITSKGDFANQWVDSWNLRGFLRWNLSPWTNISLSETFYNHAMGTNGGVDPNTMFDMYNPREAAVLYQHFNERLIRHDINLTLSSLLSEDTTTAISFTGFFTYADFYQNLPGILMEADTATNNNVPAHQTGISGKFEQEISNFLSLKVGGDLMYSFVDKGIYNDELNGLILGGFGYLAFHPIKKLLLSGGVRINSQLDRFYSSTGGKIQYYFKPGTSIFGDISFSQRIPSPVEGLSLKNENHFLILGGFNLNKNGTNFETNLYFRRVTNPITAEAVYDADDQIIDTRSLQKNALTSTGISVSFGSVIFSHLYYKIRENASFDNWRTTATFTSPRLNTDFTIFYKVDVGRSEVRFGFDVNGVYQKNWLRYFPQRRQYTQVTDNPLNQFNGINVFAHARLGNAYIKLNVRNILSSGYYFTAYYPKSNLFFNLAVNWAFLD